VRTVDPPKQGRIAGVKRRQDGVRLRQRTPHLPMEGSVG
jgi:hypothetical protein